MSKIEWTGKTWNPIIGCDKVSAGCKYCYAIRMANRLAHIPAMMDLYMDTVTVGANGQPNWTGVVKVSERSMDKPLRTNKPTLFFVNSMSDLFHDAVPFDVVDRVFAIMAICQRHTFQVLTKRAARMAEYYKAGFPVLIERWEKALVAMGMHEWKIEENNNTYPLPNVWMGVSVESQQTANERIPYLLEIDAAVRFLSCEPLLGAVDLTEVELPSKYNISVSTAAHINCLTSMDDEHFYNHHKQVDWVIVGGESGPGSRPMHPEWANKIIRDCKSNDVPVFFKQWGDWVPIDEPHKQDDIQHLAKNEQWLNWDGGMGFHGQWVWRMRKVGKAKATKRIYGKTYTEFPKADMPELSHDLHSHGESDALLDAAFGIE